MSAHEPQRNPGRSQSGGPGPERTRGPFQTGGHPGKEPRRTRRHGPPAGLESPGRPGSGPPAPGERLPQSPNRHNSRQINSLEPLESLHGPQKLSLSTSQPLDDGFANSNSRLRRYTGALSDSRSSRSRCASGLPNVRKCSNGFGPDSQTLSRQVSGCGRPGESVPARAGDCDTALSRSPRDLHGCEQEVDERSQEAHRWSSVRRLNTLQLRHLRPDGWPLLALSSGGSNDGEQQQPQSRGGFTDLESRQAQVQRCKQRQRRFPWPVEPHEGSQRQFPRPGQPLSCPSRLSIPFIDVVCTVRAPPLWGNGPARSPPRTVGAPGGMTLDALREGGSVPRNQRSGVRPTDDRARRRVC